METLYFLAWKEILVRYKLPFLGILWALFRPLMTAFVFSFLFKVEGAPYFLFPLAALLPWQFFSTSVQEMTPSLLNHANLITKVYFPRSFLPLSVMIVNGVDFFVTLLLVLSLSLIIKGPSLKLLWFPLFFFELLLLTSGVGLFLSAITIKFRDVRFIVPFFIQMLLFLSPVAYDISVVPEVLREIYFINPLVSIIEGFRLVFLHQPLSSTGLEQIISSMMTLLIFFGGVFVFNKEQRAFADAL
jgi:lipopolysaccharide transport system permease protein